MAKKRSTDKPHHRYYDTHPNVPKLSWLDLLGKTAISSDDHNLGKVEAVNSDFVVIKRGITRVSRFYVPTRELRSVRVSEKLELDVSKEQLLPFRQDKAPNPANFATLGSSTSHMAYPPIPYLPDEMLKEKYRKKPASDKS